MTDYLDISDMHLRKNLHLTPSVSQWPLVYKLGVTPLDSGVA